MTTMHWWILGVSAWFLGGIITVLISAYLCGMNHAEEKHPGELEKCNHKDCAKRVADYWTILVFWLPLVPIYWLSCLFWAIEDAGVNAASPPANQHPDARPKV